MTTVTTEVAPDIFQISTYFPDFNLQFNQFLVRDDEPLLFHTGMNALFPVVLGAVKTVIDPATLRWISFSHFEADECGALNQWLHVAPHAEPACSLVGVMVSVNDFSNRPARALEQDEILATGKYRFRFQATPHVPHCWDAGMLFEDTGGVLFCSDLFHQLGDVEPSTEHDIVGRFREALVEYSSGPLANYMPYTAQTGPILERLAALNPRTVVPMHGSAFTGDGAAAIRDMAAMMKETLGGG